MAKTVYARLTPEVLRWAREAAGYTATEAAHHAHVFTWQIDAAETGDLDLTLRQAESLARFYDRPLADLYLTHPPEEESQEALFRRLPGAPSPPWPPAMRKLARRVRNRQAAVVELYDLLEEEPPWPEARTALGEQDAELAARVRERLGITLDEQLGWRDARGYMALRSWVDAIENLGIHVMQDGGLDVEEMRGFASVDDQVPAIVINTKDDPRARCFTATHELGHLLNPTATEQWCNSFAGALLVPPGALLERFSFDSRQQLHHEVFELARAFSVTPSAMATTLTRRGLIPEEEGPILHALIRSRGRGSGSESRSGNYYSNKVTWLGPAFVRLVLDAADAHALPLSNAAGLLEAKVDHFAELRQRVESRAELV